MKKAGKLAFIFTIFIIASCSGVTVENPREDLYVTPGSNAQTSFRVINRTNQSQQMTVYQTDYSFKSDGSNEFLSPGSHPRSNAEWLNFSPRQFTIKPGMKMNIDVSVNVPNKQLTGSYWSILMVEYIDSGNNNPNADDINDQTGLTVKRRQGIQIRTHFSGTGEMKARYFNQQIRSENGKLFFDVDMENIGTLYFSGNFWIEFFDSRGKSVSKVSLERKSIYPDCSVRFSADVSHLKSGKYTALCVYDTLKNKVFGGKYQIEIP